MKLATITLYASLSALLCGCANKFETVTPEVQASMMSDLQAGRLNLDCGLKCRFTWDSQVAQIHALDIAERWPDLAMQVMKIGYGSDLAYYYLGQAAQGLGDHPAAIGYYNYALALSQGTNALLQCAAGRGVGDDPCQGVDIAGSVPVLVAASRTALEQQQAAAEPPPPPPPTHHHHRKPAVVPASDSGNGTASTGGSGWVAPPPTASQAASGSGWAAPPPASAQ